LQARLEHTLANYHAATIRAVKNFKVQALAIGVSKTTLKILYEICPLGTSEYNIL
jgi:hypothetical protein